MGSLKMGFAWKSCLILAFLAFLVQSVPVEESITNNDSNEEQQVNVDANGCKPDWQGDGYCDDDNNNELCQYDSGDCCTDTENLYCQTCGCIDPNWTAPIRTEDVEDVEDEGVSGSCAKPEYMGDGHCGDETNTPECNFDGGDCCTDTAHEYCTICQCIQQ